MKAITMTAVAALLALSVSAQADNHKGGHTNTPAAAAHGTATGHGTTAGTTMAKMSKEEATTACKKENAKLAGKDLDTCVTKKMQ